MQKNMNSLIALKQIIGKVIKETVPLATIRRSTVINDISPDTFVETDEEKLLEVLIKLLSNTIKSSHSSSIHISAEREEEKTFITVRDNNSDYSGYISGKMAKVESLVQNIGGNVYFEFNNRNSITIVLCLRHPIKAA